MRVTVARPASNASAVLTRGNIDATKVCGGCTPSFKVSAAPTRDDIDATEVHDYCTAVAPEAAIPEAGLRGYRTQKGAVNDLFVFA